MCVDHAAIRDGDHVGRPPIGASGDHVAEERIRRLEHPGRKVHGISKRDVKILLDLVHRG